MDLMTEERRAPPHTDVDDDNPPTRREDWIGARKVIPGRKSARKRGRRTMFHVYRSSRDRGIFAVTAELDETLLPSCSDHGRWEHFKSFPETGEARVGFSEAKAKTDIAKRGYHLARIDAVPRARASRR
jgi:hypothetical protein